MLHPVTFAITFDVSGPKALDITQMLNKSYKACTILAEPLRSNTHPSYVGVVGENVGDINGPFTDLASTNPILQGPFTDLASANGNTSAPIVTSVSYSFVSGDVGNDIVITSGTNWTPGTYTIVSVLAGAATLNAAVGTAASLSGGHWYEPNPAPTVTSASYNFTTADIGDSVVVTSGTSWTTGSYLITGAAANAATLSAIGGIGSAASLTGGHWYESFAGSSSLLTNVIKEIETPVSGQQLDRWLLDVSSKTNLVDIRPYRFTGYVGESLKVTVWES